MEKRVSITAKMSAFVRDFHSNKLLSRGDCTMIRWQERC